jgi:hypothetical protein
LALACTAGIAAAPRAIAAPPPKAAVAAPLINAQRLAVTERALEFCGPVDADSAKKLKDQVAELTRGASADALAQARDSEAYKQAYSSMESFIGEIDPRNAKVVCANTASGKNASGKK